MMILAVSRRLPQLLELQRERTWQPLEGREMRDLTVGVVGLGFHRPGRGASSRSRSAAGSSPCAGGRRGSAPARPRTPRRRAVRRGVLDRVGGPTTLPELLAESDFVVLGAAADARDRGPVRRRDARHDEARRVAHQRRARRARRRAGAPPRAARRPARRRRAGRLPRGAAAADSPLYDRPTSSSRRTRRGRAAACSTAASSCSATTWGASPRRAAAQRRRPERGLLTRRLD